MKVGRIPAGFWYMLGAAAVLGVVTFFSHMGGDGVNIKFNSYEGLHEPYYYASFGIDGLIINNKSVDANEDIVRIGLSNANSTEDLKISGLAFIKSGEAKTVLVSIPLDSELDKYIKSIKINGREAEERELRLNNDEVNLNITVDIDENEFNKLEKYDSLRIPVYIGDLNYDIEIIKE